MGKEWNEDTEILTIALMKYIYTKEKALIKKAVEHVDMGLTQFFKDAFKSEDKAQFKLAFQKVLESRVDKALLHPGSSTKSEKAVAVAMTVLPGASTGKAIAESLLDLRGKSTVAAEMRSDLQNFLAHMFAHYLQGKAKGDENKVFLSMFSFQVSAAASAGMSGSGLEFLVRQAVSKANWAGQKGLQFISDGAVDLSAGKGFKKSLNIDADPFGWAVYFSGTPRAPSSVENCRLALRVSLGMPHDKLATQDNEKEQTEANKALQALFNNLTPTPTDEKQAKENQAKLEAYKKLSAARAGSSKSTKMTSAELTALFEAMMKKDKGLKDLKKLLETDKNLETVATLFDDDKKDVSADYNTIKKFAEEHQRPIPHLQKFLDEMGVWDWLQRDPYKLA